MMFVAIDTDPSPPPIVSLAILAAMVALLVLLLFAAFHRTLRPRILKPLGYGIGSIIGLYAITRGVAEFFIIDYGDPESYRNDWGGPSLFGVLAVHSGPGLAALIAAVYLIRRNRAGDDVGVPSSDRDRL
ncbi:hypothetical protein [Rhodococcus globerulus]|uniref:hypothetical protein n=1 Tax=Rhodococcus globerulus TaxID=33008 RepID=UPI0030162C5D